MIWDVHTHLHGVDGRTPVERMTNLIRFADRMGVERVCVYMGYPFLTDPTPAQLRQQNDQVLQALAHFHDRAFGFVYTSGNHPEASLREFERCVANGVRVLRPLAPTAWGTKDFYVEDPDGYDIAFGGRPAAG